MQIRELTIEDFDHPMIETLFQLDFVSKKMSIQHLKDIFIKRKERTVTLIAIDNDVIIGCVVAVVHHSFIGTSLGALYDFAVAGSHHGKGIGKQLFLAIEQILADKYKVNRIIGPVGTDRIKFYSSCGCTIVENTVFMNKCLTPFEKLSQDEVQNKQRDDHHGLHAPSLSV